MPRAWTLGFAASPGALGLLLTGVGSLDPAPAALAGLQELLRRDGSWSDRALENSGWCAAASLLLLALGLWCALRPDATRAETPPPTGPDRVSWPLRLALLLVCGVALAGAADFAATKHRAIFGQDVWWLDDDMMITLRYARNLAEGEGLVWNPGERVEGITNFAWALMLTPLHWLCDEDRVSRAVMVLNAAILGALVVALGGWLRREGASWASILAATLVVASSIPTLNWTAGGGEAVLVGLILVLLAARDGRRPLVDGLWAGALYAVRPDAALVSGLLVGLRALLRLRRREASVADLLRLAAGVLAVPLALSAFRLAYYGDVLPNTYYLKATGWDGRAEAGWAYVLPLLKDYAPLWLGLLAAAGLSLMPRQEGLPRRDGRDGRSLLPVALAVTAHMAYLIRIGGDELVEQRFFVPILPLLVGVAALGVEGLWSRATAGRRRASAFGPLLAASVLLVGAAPHATLPGEAPDRIQVRTQSEFGNAWIGKLIEANTQPEARVAHFWAGAAAYFSERPGVDLYGKCDRTIARQDARPGLLKPGHNKVDFDWSLGLEPDVIVSGLPGRADQATFDYFYLGPYRPMAELLIHPEFRARFAPNPVRLEPQPGLSDFERAIPSVYHGLFVRQDSPRARPAREWRAPLASPGVEESP